MASIEATSAGLAEGAGGILLVGEAACGAGCAAADGERQVAIAIVQVINSGRDIIESMVWFLWSAR
ncbi:MAG: hypothetical protein ABI870_04885 [Rhodanobacter sp.]